MSSTTGNKKANDNYPTPKAEVEALISFLNLRPNDKFLEPCRGLNRNIYDLIKLPEEQKFWAEIDEGVDYLQTPFAGMDVIITNPPFSLTEDFIRKSLSELNEDGTMCFLQRVNFLGSIDRLEFWEEVGYPFKHPIIVPRPRFEGKGSDSCEYVWMIWDFGYRFPDIPNGFSPILTVNGGSKKLKEYLERKGVTGQ